MLAAAVASLVLTQGSDALRLPIGTEVSVAPGKLVDLRSGAEATVADVARSADGFNWVFLGENHATTAHQQMHADVIAALVKRHRKVIVGLEMYTRPKQDWLDQWSAGKIEEADFLSKSDWKGQWGYDYKFYKPIFDVVRKSKLPLVGLNVPRDWIRMVGRQGFDGLPADAKAQLPNDMRLDNGDHRKIFETMIGGHPQGMEAQMNNMYAAQVLWDEGMADTALKYLQAHPGDKNTVFVVIAGSGHVMYRQGINFRIMRRTGQTGITLVMDQSDAPRMVSRGVGDFAYVTVPEKKGS